MYLLDNKNRIHLYIDIISKKNPLSTTLFNAYYFLLHIIIVLT